MKELVSIVYVYVALVTPLHALVPSVNSLLLWVLLFLSLASRFRGRRGRRASKFHFEADLCRPAAVPTLPRRRLLSDVEDGGVVAAFGFADSTFSVTDFSELSFEALAEREQAVSRSWAVGG